MKFSFDTGLGPQYVWKENHGTYFPAINLQLHFI